MIVRHPNVLQQELPGIYSSADDLPANVYAATSLICKTKANNFLLIRPLCVEHRAAANNNGTQEDAEEHWSDAWARGTGLVGIINEDYAVVPNVALS
jgi:hypothetical protein